MAKKALTSNSSRHLIIHAIRSVGATIGHINMKEQLGALKRGDKTFRRDLVSARSRFRKMLKEHDRTHC